MGLRWTSVIWSVKWVFYYSVLLNQVNLSIDIGEWWQCNVIKVVPSTEINFWYFIVSSKPIFIFYNTNQLDLGFTKFWRFHFLLNPVHVVWNTGKYRKFPCFPITGNSNKSVLRPSLESQRTSRVALRKQKLSDRRSLCSEFILPDQFRILHHRYMLRGILQGFQQRSWDLHSEGRWIIRRFLCFPNLNRESPDFQFSSA